MVETTGGLKTASSVWIILCLYPSVYANDTIRVDELQTLFSQSRGKTMNY